MQPAALQPLIRLHRLPLLLRQRETLLKLRARRLLHRLVQLRLQAHRLQLHLRLVIRRRLLLTQVDQQRPATRLAITQAEARAGQQLEVGVAININLALSTMRGTPLLLPARRVLLATSCIGTAVKLQAQAVVPVPVQQQQH